MKEKGIVRIAPSAMAAYKDQCFFVNLWGNSLYSINVETGESTVIAQVTEEPNFTKELFTDLIVEEDILYCIPHNAKHIVIYDIINKTMFYKELPEKLKNQSGKFKKALYDKKRNELVLLGYCVSNIWCYSFDDDRLYEIELPSPIGLLSSGLIVEDELIVVSKTDSRIVRINRLNNNVRFIIPHRKENGYADIYNVNNRIIVVSFYSRSMYVLEDDDIELLTEGFTADFSIWPHGAGIPNEIGEYIYACSQKKICIYDLNIQQWKYLIFNSKEDIKGIGNPVIVSNKVIMWFYETSMFLKYDYLNDSFSISDIWSRDIQSLNFDKGKKMEIIHESEEFTLESFICALEEMKNE